MVEPSKSLQSSLCLCACIFVRIDGAYFYLSISLSVTVFSTIIYANRIACNRLWIQPVQKVKLKKYIKIRVYTYVANGAKSFMAI